VAAGHGCSPGHGHEETGLIQRELSAGRLFFVDRTLSRGHDVPMSQPIPTIRHGMFIMPFHDPAKPLAQCHDEDLELIVRAEELGFSEFWIGEHHTMKFETVVMPEIFIARALGETHRIRLGPAPVCLNQHYPGHVAGRLAFLDHLAKGRLNLCFGPGSVSADQELAGAEPANAAAMVDEAIDMILRLWSSEPPYEIVGRFWTVRLKKSVDAETGIGYVPKPFQQPHPPIAMPGTSRNSPTMRTAGRRGFQPFGHCLVPGNTLADLWQTYETAALEAGRQPRREDFKVARSIFVADSTPEARERVRGNSLGRNFQYIGRLLDKGPGRKMFKRDSAMSETECNLDYLMGEQIIAGSPDEVVRRLLGLIEETGPFGTLVLMGYDWDDKASWLRSMELFVREVMPALNKAVC
jgi:alkanesulfonate monooxygenase SsuD/methylene tetrahydromethanopterin reductase-like flavin-dependent oxidoreductase (luciferase family)